MHSETFFDEVVKIARSIDAAGVENLAKELAALRQRGGRLFFLGVGGSAANCSHAVNDFRKLCGIEAYTPVDNVSELTARTNDEGWDTVFAAWLKTSKANKNDAVFVFSVGGGNVEKNVSVNTVAGLKEARQRSMKIFGVVGRDGGYTKQVGD
ncbi:MAG: SIS domain-containing protein, partial [Betaproteobacteria bacterium]